MRIALIGSAPSSVQLAPYSDPSWTIWACSPGAIPHVKKLDAWFEIHGFPHPDFTPDYLAWMQQLTVPVYVIDKSLPDIPQAATLPVEDLLAKYGKYFFTSSLAWMFAMALEQPEVTEIGLWGVDMAATEEYASQRPGCHFFITLAQARGIKITTPKESDLLRPPPLYGVTLFESHMARKLAVRRKELEAQLATATNTYENAAREIMFFKGAIDDLNYIQSTWVS